MKWEDGRESGSLWRGSAALEREEELGMAGGGDGGGVDGGVAVQRGRRRRKGGGGGARAAAAAAWGRRHREEATEKNSWPGQGVAAVVAAAAATAVGLLPWPSVSSHLRWRRLPYFSQMTARVCGGGHFPFYRAHNGTRGERAHLRPTIQHLKILIEK